jgi:hypothetical protein
MSKVILAGWRPGLEKVRLNHLLREQAGLSLLDAKNGVDELLHGGSVVVEIADADSAMRFAEQAQVLGTTSRVEHNRVESVAR